MRRARDEQVDMVLANVTLEDLYMADTCRGHRSHDLAEPGGRRRLAQLRHLLSIRHLWGSLECCWTYLPAEERGLGNTCLEGAE